MKKLVLIVTTILITAAAFAETKSYKELVPADYVAELEKSGMVRLVHENGNDNGRYLMPENDYEDTFRNRIVAKKSGNYPFICESLYLINKKKYAKNLDVSQMNIQAVSEAVRSISKMQGMTYYSTTRKKRLVLYKSAYTLENGSSKARVNDRNTGNSDGTKNWLLFDDASFGEIRYELDYKQNENTFYMGYQNIDDVKVLFMKPVSAGNLLLQALFIDCGDDYLVYIVSDVDCMKVPGMKKQMEDSFVSRMDALSEWLADQF